MKNTTKALKQMTMNKIGLAVISYARPQYLKACLASLNANNWGGATYRLLIIDYKDEETKRQNMMVAIEAGVNNVIYFTENRGVAKAKNEAFKRMLNADCEHIFVMEDDILMVSPTTCGSYIHLANFSGLEHLNFAHHGPMNKNKKKVIEHKNTLVQVHPNCVGAFSYYSRHCLETVGLLDEHFYNAWEHVEHTMRIADAGLTTPFWYFADCPGSEKLLQEIPGSIDYSSIRPRDDWGKNIQEGKEYWLKKHGKFLPPYPHDFWNGN